MGFPGKRRADATAIDDRAFVAGIAARPFIGNHRCRRIGRRTQLLRPEAGIRNRLRITRGSGIHMSFVSSLVTLPPVYRPYDSAEVVVTLVGRRRYVVHAQADFRTELGAQEAMATVRAALQDAGWVGGPDVDGRASTSLYLSAQAIDPDHPHGRVAETFILGTRLYFSCWDAAWKRKADREMPPRPPQQSTAQR